MIPWRDIAAETTKAKDQDWGSPLSGPPSSRRKRERSPHNRTPAPPRANPTDDIIDLTWAADEPTESPTAD